MYHDLKEEISELLQKTVVDVYQAGKDYKTVSRVWTLPGYCQANDMMNASNSVPLLPSLGAVDQPRSRACNAPGGVKNHKVMLQELKATLALQISMFMRQQRTTMKFMAALRRESHYSPKKQGSCWSTVCERPCR